MVDQYNSVSFVRLGEAKSEDKLNQIEEGKLVSRIMAEAKARAKRDTCYLCGQACSSFCNSHSIPKFVLQEIATDGKIASYIQREVSPEKNDPGVKNAGTFQLICRDCDSKAFQEYESTNLYAGLPSEKMMAQIALKNHLHMIWKRNNEIEFYKIILEQFKHRKQMTQEKLYFAERDLKDYNRMYLYAKQTLEKKLSGRYYCCFYKELDYIVPYAAQAAVTLFSDFEDKMINNVFLKLDQYSIECIHIGVFPLEECSVIMAFVETQSKRYRKFYKQLAKLTLEDQLAAINYIVFSNTENVFVHNSVLSEIQSNIRFEEICKLTFDYTYQSTTPNPVMQALQEFGLSRRTEITNLLSREYALKAKPYEILGK